MTTHLVSRTTGEEINCGETLHMTSGPSAGRAWRFEHIAEKPDGKHHVHVSRCGGKLGRIHREYHPGVFGCEIKIDITWRMHVSNSARHMRSKIDDYLMAGAFALIPLALYEHFHWADKITTAFGIVGH
ncbi:hypothetical protein [Streptomyces mirabilis]|uniref:hypothetical protein n=1 Tax=Streptomyces mirabilis TaxID=68239 RepID=UPI0036BD5505